MRSQLIPVNWKMPLDHRASVACMPWTRRSPQDRGPASGWHTLHPACAAPSQRWSLLLLAADNIWWPLTINTCSSRHRILTIALGTSRTAVAEPQPRSCSVLRIRVRSPSPALSGLLVTTPWTAISNFGAGIRFSTLIKAITSPTLVDFYPDLHRPLT